MVLASAHELLEYSLHLRRTPACAAALLAPGDEHASNKENVLSSMKHEWETVLFMESSTRTHALLKSRCRFTDFQNFREIHTMMEQCQYKVTETARSLLEAWHPPFAWSANLESIFGEIQAALKKSNRSEGASMQSMMSIAVRSLGRRVCTDETSPAPLTLSADDYMGKQTAALKSKIWTSSNDFSNICDVSTNIQQAKFMLYTLHIAPDSLANKLGCGLLLRRGLQEYSLLPYLVETGKLLALPSASLTDLLVHQNVRMAKNTTVASKIRRLLAEDDVKNGCSEGAIASITNVLAAREEKKKNQKEKEEEKDESEETRFCLRCFVSSFR
ncbi:unnamed protein product [Symbiodinium sp. CCMP2592]|nr:unnamed protein product [Symbiodinium sp. CCMP2592]CAE7277861.1 unnamed protein product [Symbiodinium sp. CCMP2592]